MSVLIKGIQMPKNEPLLVKINPDGSVSTTAKNGYKKYEAVSVQPHGRLIEEADAIETACMILRGLGYLKEENPQLEQTVRKVFATAPSIEVE